MYLGLYRRRVEQCSTILCDDNAFVEKKGVADVEYSDPPVRSPAGHVSGKSLIRTILSIVREHNNSVAGQNDSAIRVSPQGDLAIMIPMACNASECPLTVPAIPDKNNDDDMDDAMAGVATGQCADFCTQEPLLQ
jgi:hypothetical protein